MAAETLAEARSYPYLGNLGEIILQIVYDFKNEVYYPIDIYKKWGRKPYYTFHTPPSRLILWLYE